VAFGASQTGPPILTSSGNDGEGKPHPLLRGYRKTEATDPQLPTDWSRDGQFIAFDTSLGEDERQVWLGDIVNGKIIPLLHNEFAQWGAAFSPEGGRIAFISEASGRPEVYVQAFDPAPSPHVVGERRQISREGGSLVRWRRDGRELFFLGADNWLYAVATEAPLKFGVPKRLFQFAGPSLLSTTSDFQFDVTADGQRFVASTIGSVPPPRFTVIENWEDKLYP